MKHEEVLSGQVAWGGQVFEQAARVFLANLRVGHLVERLCRIDIRLKNHIDVLLQRKADLLVSPHDFLLGVQNRLIANNHFLFKWKRINWLIDGILISK